MDLQGTPIGNTTTGTKVTSDPERYNRPVQEKPGAIANDSLAAESVKQGGAFQRNADAAPLDVSGSSSTLNNTNTSGASQLSSSRDAATRDPDNKERYPDSLGGQGSFPGAHVPETGYVGGPTSAKKNLGIGQEGYPASEKGRQPAEASGSGVRSSHYGGPAPSYIEPVIHNPGNTKPKGQNLKEGGFTDKKNASWNTDIGSRNDPGRLAENKFERYNKESGIDAGYTKQSSREDPSSAQPYGALRNEESI
ncbi:hypothetical protein C8Q69DRAFT_467509 [Paecilomyces variotii]|uniref:Uncharacterized protein n=1 Tax=Byssochlamys spectabilis TaxID=264951 RepID=A0A443HVF5_BYSSP|nr:hypothetical protein C8Q69DRAFT_467509 [Paecilomyces variotii]KAJ9351862.1 hypothetical protein DTO280E4_8087 [Paecilomyces variotii]RWQ95802.1 hypothetical protein C8Q69DRAFT_467509 [Paecilomyces variotii]